MVRVRDISTRLLGTVAAVAVGVSALACSDATTPTGPDEGNGDPSVTFDSRATAGDSARSFLDDRRFTVLAVEVDYMEGYEPKASALDSMKVSLEKHLHKSAIEIGEPTSVPARGKNAYTVEDVVGLEEEYRDHYTRAESDTIWAYFLIVDGEFSEDRVLGIAYFNTSMAFFGKTIHEISGGPTQPTREKVEGTVFRHEFGHILGLVEAGTSMQQDHRDEANGHHCTNEQCLMYYAIETTDYFANLFDGDRKSAV